MTTVSARRGPCGGVAILPAGSGASCPSGRDDRSGNDLSAVELRNVTPRATGVSWSPRRPGRRPEAAALQTDEIERRRASRTMPNWAKYQRTSSPSFSTA